MTISETIRRRVREAAGNRCGYCQVSAKFIYGFMEIEHIQPKATGGSDDEENLWLACSRCNTFKGEQSHAHDPLTGKWVALFNPRRQIWSEHFMWDEKDKAAVVGKTACGRATVLALQMNSEEALLFRQLLVSVGWHP